MGTWQKNEVDANIKYVNRRAKRQVPNYRDIFKSLKVRSNQKLISRYQLIHSFTYTKNQRQLKVKTMNHSKWSKIMVQKRTRKVALFGF